jgi:hypothetical protein
MTAMKNVMTNRDQIAGLPAFSIRQFLSDCEEPIDVKSLQSWLLLDDKAALAVFQFLISDGYLKTDRLADGTAGLVKTGKARRMIQVASQPSLSREEGYNIFLNLLREIAAINVNPATAHHIESVKLAGQILTDDSDELTFVEAEILISPHANAHPELQREWEKIAAEYAERSGHHFASEEDRDNWSMQLIKDRLYDVHDKLCLRIV